MDITALTAHVNRLGEGPTWDAANDRLIWTDIEGRALHTIRVDGSDFATWPMADRVGSFGLCESGRLIVAFAHSIAYFDPATGGIEEIGRVDDELATNRFNDGKVGPDGAFWVGTMDERPNRQKVGSLYRVTGDGRIERRLHQEVFVSNGLAWTGDGRRMYYSDSRAAWIDRFDFDPATGEMTNRTRIATLEDATGRPDGATCDSLGRYWSAGVSAGFLNCFEPDGTLVEHIKVPVAAPTMPCFGGPDLKTLFVTSLIEGVSDERMNAHPLSGRLIKLDVGVAGIPANLFRDRR